MQPSNVLQQMLRADHTITDPGDGGYIDVKKVEQWCSLNPSTTETRIMRPPCKAGIKCYLGCIAAQTVVVTVQKWTASTNAVSSDGTVTFSGTSQWISFISTERTSGVFTWDVSDVYGCTTDKNVANNVSGGAANATFTNVVVQTGLTVGSTAVIKSVNATTVSAASAYAPVLVATAATSPSIVATNLTAASVVNTQLSCASTASIGSVIATALTSPSIVATNVTAASVVNTQLSCASTASVGSVIATALTSPSIVVTSVTAGAATVTGNQVLGGGTVQISGGTAGVDTQATALLSPVCNMISVVDATNNYFKLPVAAQGLQCNVINLGSTAGLVGHTAGVSIASATSVALATANAVGSAVALVCDGTNWWHRAM